MVSGCAEQLICGSEACVSKGEVGYFLRRGIGGGELFPVERICSRYSGKVLAEGGLQLGCAG